MIIAGENLIGEVLKESDKLIFIGSFQDSPVQWELDVELIGSLPIKDEQKLKAIKMLKPRSFLRRVLFT